MNLDRPITEILQELASGPDAPEPPPLTSSLWEPYNGPYDPAYDVTPLDPQSEAIRRLTAALRAAERERQAEREARIRQIVRDYCLLRRLLAEVTPAELPPVRECAPRPMGRADYRGWMP